LQGETPVQLIQRGGGLTSYVVPQESANEFSWRLIEAVYLGKDFPIADDIRFVQAVSQLNDVNNLSREHISHIPDKGLAVMGPLLERADEVMAAIARVVPEVLPFVRWYQTEKLRIAPGEASTILQQTIDVHEKLQRMLSVYVLTDTLRGHEPNFKE
jgi:hypothetical protein